MTYFPEDGLSLLGDINVRFVYFRIPLAVFLYHIKCYICNELGEVKVRITQGMNRHNPLMI